MQNPTVKTAEFFKRASSMAEHYGFMPVGELSPSFERKSTRDLELISSKAREAELTQHAFLEGIQRASDLAALPRKDPLLFYTPMTVVSKTPGKRLAAIAFNVVATRQPLAEVLVLKAATSLLDDLGVKDVRIRINSIGDRDSSARFMRDAIAVVRKHLGELSPAHREMAKIDIAALVLEMHRDKHPLLDEMPRSVESLTAPSRKHFRDVLEHLDSVDLPFDLDERFIASRSHYAHVIFELVASRDPSSTEAGTDEACALATGGRYDELTRVVMRSAVPSVGIVLALPTSDACENKVRMRVPRPRAVLVHVGVQARMRSFDVLEAFRRARVPVEQCLQFERFSEQLEYAERSPAPYIVIMGQKEALEGVVIVRNNRSRSQTVVSIENLPAYFKAATVKA